MNKLNLSIAIATFNEEENIKRCLDRVKEWVYEIVVVDGKSNDKTVEIARGSGAKVIVVKNQAVFHINKQKAIDACRGEWVLQLDADEIVSEGLASEIKNVIQHSDSNGYWVPRKNFFLGRFLKKGGQYPDYTLRLYRRGMGKLPAKDVHEQAVVEGNVGYLKNSLLHYPYKNFYTYLIKWNRYTDLISSQIRDELKRKNLMDKMFYGVLYVIIKPIHWFLLTYVRHKGFMDGWQGFVFSFFSALRFPFSYFKYIIS